MIENKYSMSSGCRPRFKYVLSLFSGMILVCLVPGVIAADTPSAPALQTNDKLPVVSASLEKSTVVSSPAQEMPPLTAESVEIATTAAHSPDVGAKATNVLRQIPNQLDEVGLSAQSERVEPYSISASLTPADYMLPGHAPDKVDRVGQDAKDDTGGNTAVVGENDDQQQLPYALVLALMAIIGLVPVSRRNH